MCPTFQRSVAAIATLVVGVLIGSLHQHARQRPAPPPPAVALAAATPEPVEEAFVEAPYPEELSTSPTDIAQFLEDHPRVNLARLWERLGITSNDPNSASLFDRCGYCASTTFQYNLEGDADGETVLQIKEIAESYRYLVFKADPDGGSRFIGHIDAWAKYPPTNPVVMISNGRPWLIVESTAGTGSGFGAWRQTVYDIANGKLRAVGSYIARLHEAGIGAIPARVLVGRPLACEIRGGHAKLTLSYTLEYLDVNSPGIPTSSTKRKVVLLGSLKDGSTSFDAQQSEITKRDFETEYSMDRQ